MPIKTDYELSDLKRIVAGNSWPDKKRELFISWVEPRIEQFGFWCHPLYMTTMFNLWYRTTKDKDGLVLIDGEERSGKSRLSINTCKFINPDFDTSYMWQDINKFDDILQKAKQGDLSLCTEAGDVFPSREYLSKKVVAGIQMLKKIGFHNMLHIMAMPSVFEIDKYLKTSRIKVLGHVRYRTRDYAFFDIYHNNYKKNDMRIAQLISTTKNNIRSYNFVRPNLKFMWAYKNLKGITKLYRKFEKWEKDYKLGKQTDGEYKTIDDLQRETGLSYTTLRREINRGNLISEKVGGRILIDLKEYNKYVNIRMAKG